MEESAEVNKITFYFIYFFLRGVYTLTNTASIAMANIKYCGDFPDDVVLQGIRPNFEVQTQASICMPDE